MRFINELHPELVIADLGVRFTNGQTDVDAKTAALLRRLPAELGVRPASATADEPSVPKPELKGRPGGRRES